MKLIIGLGNPGKKYKNSRHNVGYMVIQKLQDSKTLKLKNLIAIKTNCFMNESGEFVKKLVEQYKLNCSDLWVIHDDLDIPLGSYKIRKGKGPREHNGLLSIYDALGTKDFWHVRIGVENREKMENGKWKMENFTKGEQYVLQDFTKEEVLQVEQVIKRVVKELCKKLATS